MCNGRTKKKQDFVFDLDHKLLFVKDTIEIKIISDISDYFGVIDNLTRNRSDKRSSVFYRGQSSLNYWLCSSVGRTGRHYRNEHLLYQELIMRCPNYFSHCENHIDYLVLMQHYGLPTRLLDITTNPLVALYFASLDSRRNKSKVYGEVVLLYGNIPDTIKYERSDTVSILSSMPVFTENEKLDFLRWAKEIAIEMERNKDSGNEIERLRKEFNESPDHDLPRLLGEIRIEKPAFLPIISPHSLYENIIVTPGRRNSRIMNQAGGFVLQGLFNINNFPQEGTLDQMRFKNPQGRIPIIIIPNKAKEHIRKQLETLNINKASMFPEIDDVADYLKDDYDWSISSPVFGQA